MPKNKVLFLCTGNSARSEMAEACLRKYAGERFEVFSAGLEPGDIHPQTRRVMAEIGLDLRGQSSKSVTEYLGKVNFGYLITLCARAEKNCPTVFPGISETSKPTGDFVEDIEIPTFPRPKSRKSANSRQACYSVVLVSVCIGIFEDPAEFAGSDAETLEKFHTVRDQIDARVRAWLVEQSVTLS